MCPLFELSLQTPARVLKLHTPADLTQRLCALGLRPGREVTVLRRGWLGGPLQLRIGSTELMLRREHARAIVVETLPVQEG
ncbi:ferrous iron transport protein A [Silvimonas terrae]|uniref:Ferrous iron transport protein A n=1 Tax=Silvimonas terrae TaxID=300266 RepID=A0A840RG18_9NEIS|nr:FeoA family protein [Silvimonas terrae]MBB5191360.1 ferrous iron transport protein A [Silvimonas terrae]